MSKKTDENKSENKSEKPKKSKGFEKLILAFLIKCQLLTGLEYSSDIDKMANLWNGLLSKTGHTVEDLQTLVKELKDVQRLPSYIEFITMLEKVLPEDNVIDFPIENNLLLNGDEKESVKNDYERKPVTAGVANG